MEEEKEQKAGSTKDGFQASGFLGFLHSHPFSPGCKINPPKPNSNQVLPLLRTHGQILVGHSKQSKP